MILSRKVFAGILVLASAYACSSGDKANNVPATHPLLADSKCGSCRIVAETLAVLGQEADTIAINEGATPVVDSRGRFYVLEKGGTSILVFGPDGRLIDTFGRAGSGPGEFRSINEIHVAAGDTLLAIGGGVVHVIAPDYHHVRQAKIEDGGDAGFLNTILADGRIVRLASENAFSLLDRNGVQSETIMLQGVDTTKCEQCGVRTFREGIEAGTIWSGQHNRYRIERHSINGEFLQGFTRRINWFPEWVAKEEEQAVDVMQELARPRMFGVRQTADGLLWTHILMVDDPDRITMPDLSKLADETGGEAASRGIMSDIMSNFVTQIEAIDPVSRQVLATRELKMIVVPMLRDMVAQMNGQKR